MQETWGSQGKVCILTFEKFRGITSYPNQANGITTDTSITKKLGEER